MTLLDLATPDAALPCFKYFLFGFNFVIWVSYSSIHQLNYTHYFDRFLADESDPYSYFQVLGVALLAIGIIIRTDDALFEYTRALDLDRYNVACYICIAIGALIIIMAFLGCLGAAVESPCILIFVSNIGEI